MKRNSVLLQWLRPLLLALALVAGAVPAQAQMTGNFSGDIVIVDSALNDTLAATAGSNPDAARVTMQELYRQWLLFRAKNFGAYAVDSEFITGLERFEAELYAASQSIDRGLLATAHDRLQVATKLLQGARRQQPEAATAIR